MEFLIGRPISSGYGRGIAVVFDSDAMVEIPRYQIEPAQVDRELERLRQALARSSCDIQELEARVSSELGYPRSLIFSAHLALLHDKAFLDRIQVRICRDRMNAEQALDLVVEEIAEQMRTLVNPYLRERARDVRDIGNRVLKQLVNVGIRPYSSLHSQSVIVAHELLPSETIDLDRDHVVAIVTEEGGENSHAAILARALGIPAVTGVSDATKRIAPGTEVLVDGQSGRITVTPTAAATDDFRVLTREFATVGSAAVHDEFLDCVTLDGAKVTLLANINRPAEAALVTAHNLEGVGLFRTEFLVMDSSEPPDFERQFAAYREVLESLPDRSVVIRTFDLGGDKVPRFFTSTREANPNLGLRGLRFALSHPEMLDTQLRAIIAAGEHHDIDDVRVLFPMVLGESDLQQAIDKCRVIASQGKLARCPAIGAMIETPSALFALTPILKCVDFVSIGTNDLIQFMLAADRNAVQLAGDYSILHPSVLRAVRTVVDACDAAGRALCVCGEAAGDPATACLLIGLGVRQLSLSPLRAARVRFAIRKCSLTDLHLLAERAVSANSADTVRQMLRDVVDGEGALESNYSDLRENRKIVVRRQTGHSAAPTLDTPAS